MKETRFFHYPKGQKIKREFFKVLFSKGADEVERCLTVLTQKNGFTLDEEHVCYLAKELPQDDAYKEGDIIIYSSYHKNARDEALVMNIEDFLSAVKDEIDRRFDDLHYEKKRPILTLYEKLRIAYAIKYF